MSKKECKRVPSYAIRHLIQSLKEKGRTCRKGAEQRIDREILICDPEEEYVRRLAEALLLKKEVTAGVRICSSPEMVQELLKIGLIKVLLISEDVPYEKRKQIFTGKRIILTRQHCVDLGEEETELRKYQPVDGLMTGILKGLQEEKFPGSCADNGNGRILGVYSPVHRIGTPIVDARLEDGSRVNVVLPPVALNGPIVTIRKFPKSRITMETMIDTGSIGKEAATMLIQAVKAKYNIFISGGTGSGKTTFLNVLSDFIPKEERIITIEDSAELQITGIPNLVRLEARNANVEGTGEINIRDLIGTAIRMRPERIIVGEVRGEEALDMLQAFICTI